LRRRAVRLGRSTEKINCHWRRDDECNDDCADYLWDAESIRDSLKS
jgi:hypothetical protein